MDSADLLFAGWSRQAAMVRAKEVSARELVQAALDRIAALDRRLNAFRIVLAEQALVDADRAQERLDGGDDAPLLGVPVAIKDDVDVAGEVTTYGTSAFDEPAAEDAEVVRRLRAAGAVVVGKTNAPELTIWPFTETPSYGATRNPWDLTRTPGGSSGGSGAAVAAGLVGAALGSDGAGSIRIPAACCGLFGIKPQRDRVSRAPKVEGWHGLSVLGPLARRVEDAALFLDVTAGAPGGAVAPGPGGPFGEAARRPPGRLRVALSAKVPSGFAARLGPEQRGALESTADLLRSLGHDVFERDPDYGPAGVRLAARYLRGIADDAAGVPHPERLARRTRGMARLGRLVPDRALAAARRAEAEDTARLNEVLRDADVMLMPVLATPPVAVGKWDGRSALWTFNGAAAFVPYCGVWNHTGQPAVAVPAGWTPTGLPLSVQLVGRPHDEATLISLSAQIEAERPWADRRPPVS